MMKANETNRVTPDLGPVSTAVNFVERRKKTWSTPILVEHGGLEQITQGGVGHGVGIGYGCGMNHDGGMGGGSCGCRNFFS